VHQLIVHKLYEKHFVAALKSNRLVALSLEDKKEGRFVHVNELDLSDKQAVRGYLKGFDHEVLLVRRIFKNKDGSINFEDAEEFQDEVGKFIVEAINEKLNKQD
jgi:hypothetical protein